MEGNNNVINNYKGVMLCSRPNQNNNAPTEKPFCGRVYNHEQIGLVPIKKEGSPIKQIKKPLPSILNKHKQWLQEFKEKQNKIREQIQQKTKQQQQKFRKIKQKAQVDRQKARKMKDQYNQTATQVLNILDDQVAPKSRPGQLNAQNLRRLNQSNDRKDKEKLQQHTKQLLKKNKNIKRPEWAITQEQKIRKQQEQVDDLLQFFDNNQVQKFSEDEQVKNILKNLKEKIKQIKEKEDWKEKELKRLKQKQQKRRSKQYGDDDDKVTNFSAKSQAKSIASQKTEKKLEQLRQKKQQNQEWDKYTSNSKQSFANVDEKIAKNIADEVLRNYPHLRGVHSNTSIRKLLEAEAARAINEPIIRPVITTIVKDPKPLDTNNLPYLHRNPSI